ncbi:hypothetical protein FACS189447_08370 [Spirochaetia bacterium]|nr:hypothetical protein FACS189447_08370 [Spirochaetia bacterium]
MRKFSDDRKIFLGVGTFDTGGWNCLYGFEGEKPGVIKEYNADILVIPECREMDMESSGYGQKQRDWYGDHKEVDGLAGDIRAKRDLGIGVFWKEGITITRLPEWDNSWRENNNFRYLVPYKIEENYVYFLNWKASLRINQDEMRVGKYADTELSEIGLEFI